jgi:DNA-binding protein H-NS
MKLDTLDALNDEELRAVTTRANELLKSHDDERKAKAIADAKALQAKMLADTKALLAQAGLSLKDMGTKKPRSGKTPAYHVGRQYRHPANKELMWNGKGQKPGWLRELEGEGGKALEVTPEAANDDAPKTAAAPVRKQA